MNIRQTIRLTTLAAAGMAFCASASTHAAAQDREAAQEQVAAPESSWTAAASVRDMYAAKPRAQDAPEPVAMPVVVSAGTPAPGDRDGCMGPSGAVCVRDSVSRLFHFDIIDVPGGESVTVGTEGLKTREGGGTPDTILLVLKCGGPGCARGSIVAIDDNGNDSTGEPLDSMAAFTAEAGAVYRVFVAAASGGGDGLADISVSIGGVEASRFDDTGFGGWRIDNREVRAEDALFVGKNSNSMSAGAPGHREYHDSQMLFVSAAVNDCDSDCGEFFYSDDFAYGDSAMFLSRIDIPAGVGPMNGTVFVGVHDDVDSGGRPYTMNARLFHHRRNVAAGGAWQGADTLDADGDGLTAEIERVVGSCDAMGDQPAGGVGIKGMSCADYARRILDFGGEWSALDSDNDGIRDGAEVFAAGVRCDRAPRLPYNNPGRCRAFGFFDSPACPDGMYCVGVDVSALSDPNPNVYDVYIFNDYIRSGGTEYRVTAQGQEMLKLAWHDAPLLCWDGTDAPCEGADDLPYLFNVHAYSDDGPGLPVTMHDFVDARFGSEVGGGVRWTLGYFDRFFRPEFKYTGIGFYALSTAGPEGQSKRSYRSLAWRGAHDNDDRSHPDVLAILSHESGHILGLTDLDYTKFGYRCGNPADCPVVCPEIFTPAGRDRSATAWPQYPNVPSLMNYGYNSFGAGMRDLSSGPPTGTSRYHEGCSRANLRFSKGLLGALSENRLHEINPVSGEDVATWADRMLVRELECFTDKGRGKAPETDPFKGRCDAAGRCVVNWDAFRNDGTSPSNPDGPYIFDLSMGNLGGAPVDTADCSNDVIADRNELATMQAIGKESRGRMYQPEFEIYKATFNGGVPENLAGWEMPVVESGVAYDVPAGTEACAEAGESCGDRNLSSTLRRSAVFGRDGPAYIRLAGTGPESPLVAIPDSDKLMIRFDFFADGPDADHPVQFLIGSGDVTIYLERKPGGDGVFLNGYVGSSRVRVEVEPRRWHRLFLHTDVIDGRNVIKLAVASWNPVAGRFSSAGESCPGCAVKCSSSTWTGDFDANSDFWIGSHVDGLFPFTGQIDDVNIGNFVFRPAVPKCP